jgi:hypothetical protein
MSNAYLIAIARMRYRPYDGFEPFRFPKSNLVKKL